MGCFGLSFLGSRVLFLFSVNCCGFTFGVSCVYFLCTMGRLYAFLINLFLPIKKKLYFIGTLLSFFTARHVCVSLSFL